MSWNIAISSATKRSPAGSGSSCWAGSSVGRSAWCCCSGCMRCSGTHPWWLWATAGWLAVTLVLGRLLPVLILPLFYKVTPPGGRAAAERLAAPGGRHRPERRGDLSAAPERETRKGQRRPGRPGPQPPRAAGRHAAGSFTPEEIEVVFAHEVGHHVHRHLPKMVAISVVLTAGGLLAGGPVPCAGCRARPSRAMRHSTIRPPCRWCCWCWPSSAWCWRRPKTP